MAGGGIAVGLRGGDKDFCMTLPPVTAAAGAAVGVAGLLLVALFTDGEDGRRGGGGGGGRGFAMGGDTPVPLLLLTLLAVTALLVMTVALLAGRVVVVMLAEELGRLVDVGRVTGGIDLGEFKVLLFSCGLLMTIIIRSLLPAILSLAPLVGARRAEGFVFMASLAMVAGVVLQLPWLCW